MAAANVRPARRFRSRDWFDDRERPDQAALYLERYMNFGITPEELRSGRPVIGIAQTGSDLVPCNRHHLDLADLLGEGLRRSHRNLRLARGSGGSRPRLRSTASTSWRKASRISSLVRRRSPQRM